MKLRALTGSRHETAVDLSINAYLLPRLALLSVHFLGIYVTENGGFVYERGDHNKTSGQTLPHPLDRLASANIRLDQLGL